MDAPKFSADAGQYLRQLEAVCVNATVALFIMDARQQRTYMNPAGVEATGYTREEILGRLNIAQVVAPSTLSRRGG